MTTSGSPSAGAGSNRREFLAATSAAAGVATVGYFWFDGFFDPGRRARVEPTVPGAPRRTFDAVQWRTLEAAQDRLLPSTPDAPGARTVNAVGYLDAVLAESFLLPTTAPLVLDGAGKLHQRARRQGAAEFARLSPAQQDAAIRVFEATEGGRSWLRKVLSYTLEAFFGDPVHGGNPDGVAWKWARHRPGFPRPEERGWRMREK